MSPAGETSPCANEPIVGVIGGMGPGATAEFLRRIVLATDAADDADHIHVIADSNPRVPSRIRALIEGDGEDPAPVLTDMARRLEQHGADFLVMPCNTAHCYRAAIAAAVSVPVWDMVDLTLELVAARTAGTRVGLLASPALRRIALYEQPAARRGMSIIYPRDEEALLDVIRAVKADRVGEAERRYYGQAAAELMADRADALVLACTEFSLLPLEPNSGVPTVDSLQVLVDSVVRAVKAARTEPIPPQPAPGNISEPPAT